MGGVTFNNGVKVVPAVIASQPDQDGVVQLFAPEADGNDVKQFQGKKSDSGEAEYERA
jgi:hypothetical protein